MTFLNLRIENPACGVSLRCRGWMRDFARGVAFGLPRHAHPPPPIEVRLVNFSRVVALASLCLTKLQQEELLESECCHIVVIAIAIATVHIVVVAIAIEVIRLLAVP